MDGYYNPETKREDYHLKLKWKTNYYTKVVESIKRGAEMYSAPYELQNLRFFKAMYHLFSKSPQPFKDLKDLREQESELEELCRIFYGREMKENGRTERKEVLS